MLRPIAICVAVASLPAAAAADEPSNPCFDGPPLVAANVQVHLRRYSSSVVYADPERPLPSTTYGRCKVRDATLFDGRGRRLARLHCGMEVERRGFIDHLGLEVGATGAMVIERTRPEKHQVLSCIGYLKGSRCGYYSNRGVGEPPTSYIVKRKLPDGTRLTGADAERFFRGQRVARLFVTGACH